MKINNKVLLFLILGVVIGSAVTYTLVYKNWLPTSLVRSITNAQQRSAGSDSCQGAMYRAIETCGIYGEKSPECGKSFVWAYSRCGSLFMF